MKQDRTRQVIGESTDRSFSVASAMVGIAPSPKSIHFRENILIHLAEFRLLLRFRATSRISPGEAPMYKRPLMAKQVSKSTPPRRIKKKFSWRLGVNLEENALSVLRVRESSLPRWRKVRMLPFSRYPSARRCADVSKGLTIAPPIGWGKWRTLQYHGANSWKSARMQRET